MADKFLEVNIVQGPGDWKLLIDGVHDRKPVEFTLDFPWGKSKCSATIRGIPDICEEPSTVAVRGRIEWKPGKEVLFLAPKYNWETRLGSMRLIFDEEMELHPVCLHLIKKGTRYCPDCNANAVEAEE